nr:immunoglobulin heavy chain junction region [Macaca mulatta]MOW78071.1 immunoglobulin heavy chain junction region [Macaca mulatta]MOW86196.1 immunoglobulin heavy chain junction region [Macaca mulatta]
CSRMGYRDSYWYFDIW